MDTNFAKLVNKLNSLLFAATLLEREPGEKLDSEYRNLPKVYREILEAEIGAGQRDALIGLYYEVVEVYHRAMD